MGAGLDPGTAAIATAATEASTMRHIPLTALGLILALGAGAASAQARDPSADTDAAFAPWSGDETPGCAVAVERDGVTLLTRAYGMANLEHGVRATDQTVFEAGSVAKQFVAAGIVMLALDGRLSLDDDVRRHVPELPDYGTPITLRQMLNHTSGLRDWGAMVAIEGWPRGQRYMTNARVLDVIIRQRALNNMPGAEFIYSNSNYNLLTIVLERVSGQSLQSFTEARFFQPLGMSHSRWRDDYAAVVPGRATAYGRDGAGRWRADMPLEDAHGNGGLLTTVGDLLIWNRALDEGRFGPVFMAEMLRPGVLNDGRAISYASGLFVSGEPGRREVSHAGATAGYRAWLGFYPDQHLSLALLCNAADVNSGALALRTVVAFAPELAPPVLPRVVLPPTGDFVSDETGELLAIAAVDGVARTADGRLVIAGEGGRFNLGDDVLIFDGPDRFERMDAQGRRIRYQRPAAPALDAGIVSSLIGDWRSDEALATARIRAGDQGGLTLQFPNARPQAVTATRGEALAFPQGEILIDRDSSGAPVALRITVDRSRGIVFRRVG